MGKKFVKKHSTKKVVVKETKNLLDDLSEVSLAITARFSIIEISMKNDWRWKVKMSIHEILPKTHHDYKVKLEFDDRPFLKTIESLDKDIAELAYNPSLLPSVDAKSLNELEMKKDKVKIEMETLKKDCPTIDFVTQTEEIKYKDGDTSLLFRVIDSVIQPLNEQKHRLNNYRAVLEPVYN